MVFSSVWTSHVGFVSKNFLYSLPVLCLTDPRICYNVVFMLIKLCCYFQFWWVNWVIQAFFGFYSSILPPYFFFRRIQMLLILQIKPPFCRILNVKPMPHKRILALNQASKQASLQPQAEWTLNCTFFTVKFCDSISFGTLTMDRITNNNRGNVCKYYGFLHGN